MRRRIIISLGLLLVLCVAGDAIAMWSLYRSIGQLSILAESHRIQALRTDLASGSVRIQRDLLRHMVFDHDHMSDEYIGSMQRFEESLRRCGACHHVSAIQDKLTDIGEMAHEYKHLAGQFFSVEDLSEEPLLQHLQYEMRDRAERLVWKTTKMVDEAAFHLEQKSHHVAASVRYAWRVLSMTVVVALIFGGIVAFHLERHLTKPVGALLEGIARARKGDRTSQFSIHADKEFRILAQAFEQAYEDMNNAHDGVLQAEKLAAVGKLASGVAHEVSNPLASISSIAQMMRRRCNSDDQAEEIRLILEQVDRISKIVRDLLEFSRPMANNRRDTIQVSELLDQAATLMRYDKRASKIDIVCHHDPNLRPVYGEPDRLLLVFTNIVINACDAVHSSGDGSGILEISTRQKDSRVMIRFKDSGPGMTRDEIDHAYEPFFTTKDPGSGTGLGLWICYQVIQRHEGTIRIDSSAGQGTIVTVELPCNVAPRDRSEDRRLGDADHLSKVTTS